MAPKDWKAPRSRERIKAFIEKAPTVDRDIHLMRARSATLAKATAAYPRGRAVLVEGAHVYGQLTKFESIVADAFRGESEETHQRILQFLDAFYKVWDSMVEEGGADTVDFHGPRLHAIVTNPEGDPKTQVQKAVALATALSSSAKMLGDAFGFPAEIRFGIDHGKCLAMTTGREHETETLFLGSAANHAAKLAAGKEPGIYLTPSAEDILRGSLLEVALGMRRLDREEAFSSAARTYPFPNIATAASRIVRERPNRAIFSFHRHRPPLSGIKFGDLMPSNSIRMGMASLFADVDGYTRFVDDAILRGTDAIRTAVVGIHVIRQELNAVLRYDFDGKRVRFIGDCIQGVIAEEPAKDNATSTVDLAMKCAGGMQSSFDLCKEAIPGLDSLGLAIGIEHGIVPMTRLGRSGEDSIRCATGKAVINAERMQQAIEGSGVKLGPEALKVASRGVVRNFAETSALIPYAQLINLIGAPEAPTTAIITRDREARPYLTR